jgi:hypothetical protein
MTARQAVDLVMHMLYRANLFPVPIHSRQVAGSGAVGRGQVATVVTVIEQQALRLQQADRQMPERSVAFRPHHPVFRHHPWKSSALAIERGAHNGNCCFPRRCYA